MSIVRNRLDYFYQQYLQGTLTPDERNEWQAFLDDVAQEDTLKSLMDKDYDGLKEEMLVEVNEKRNAEIVNHILSHPRTVRRTLWSSTIFKTGIAAAIAAIVFGVWFFNGESPEINSGQASDVVYKSDIAPGKQGATLTLANGKKIKLSDASTGELAKEAGVIIKKTADGQITYEIQNTESQVNNKTNTLSTARGETYKVKLPDGSIVWLNAASTLTYPASFANKEQRRVHLTGEGYFEIAKDKAHPFIVTSDKQDVEVLGTHFNINTYQDNKEIKTTLLEGSVRVRHAEFISASRNRKANMQGVNSRAGVLKQVQDDGRLKRDDGGASQGGESIILKPGQQTTIKNNEISVATVDTDDVIAWKNGDIQFGNQSIPEIMSQISRWYGVEVVYEGPVPTVAWSGSVSRERPLSQVMRMMEKSKEAKFRIEGKTIIVSK